MDLALFDFDSTLTTRDTFGDVLMASTPPWRRILGGMVLAPCVFAFRRGWVSPHAMRTAATAAAMAGRDARDVRAALQAVASTLLPALECPAMRARLEKHRARGDRIVVVSGNYAWLLAPWCRARGIECLASRLEVRGRWLTGRYFGAQCVGQGKVDRVRAHLDLSAYARVHAYGDSHEDRAMLDLAHVRVFRGQTLDAAA